MELIVVDTPALLAMLQNEPERAAFAAKIARTERRVVSAVSMLEAGMVAFGRRGQVGLSALDELVTDLEIEIIPFDSCSASTAANSVTLPSIPCLASLPTMNPRLTTC